MATVRYTNIEGQIQAEKRAGTRSTYVPDVLGSAIATTNQAQALDGSRTFWPFGMVSASAGTIVAQFGFVGTWGYRMASGPLVYVRARTIHRVTGRWLSAEPNHYSQPTLYAYARNNPTNDVDPTGLLVRICQVPLPFLKDIPCANSKLLSHWFFWTDMCGCQGYGPGGIMPKCSTNISGGGGVPKMHCMTQPYNRRQEKCICDNARSAAAGNRLRGSTWCGNRPGKWEYWIPTHNCQDFVDAVLSKCVGGTRWPEYVPPEDAAFGMY